MKAIYFCTDTCGPCKFFYPKAEKICKNYGMELDKISLTLEENSHFKEKYDLKTVPTIIILDGEDEIFRHVGVANFTVGGKS